MSLLEMQGRDGGEIVAGKNTYIQDINTWCVSGALSILQTGPVPAPQTSRTTPVGLTFEPASESLGGPKMHGPCPPQRV